MTHKFLYIIDPLERLIIEEDTSVAILQEAQARGIKNFACQIEDLFLKDGRCHALAAHATFDGAKLFYTEEKKEISFDEFQVVFMRKDPPVDLRFITSLLLLRAHNPKKTLVINDPQSILWANEKLFGLDILKNYVPKTLVTSNPNLIKEFLKQEKKIVLKPLNRAGGSGILVFEHGDRNLNSALEITLNYEQNAIIAQKYIEKADEGDKRILLLGGEVLGAILRKPLANDFRANLHYGGTAFPTEISQKELLIIETLKPFLIKHNLHFVGIDIIGEFLTEINVTSPTTITYMEEFYKINLRAKVLDYVLKLIQ